MRRECLIVLVVGATLVWSGACFGIGGDPSLIGWWKLDEAGGTGATDSSGNGNDATLVGSAAHTTGLYGGGVYCDGTEAYVADPRYPNRDLYGGVLVQARLGWHRLVRLPALRRQRR